jgi:hypothetical protein
VAPYFQDDAREQSMRLLFNLSKDGGRGDSDAYMMASTTRVEFELKTTSDKRGSVTTVRDFGPDHIAKWKNKHWLFAFYDAAGNPKRYVYGSPRLMAPWIEKMAEYIRPDFEAALVASERLTLADMSRVLGDKPVYSLNDAMSLHKKQFSKAEYLKLQDVAMGYSPDTMLKIFQGRVRYLIERGSTLNNPHIPGSYFDGWTTEISANHPAKLKQFVDLALAGKL